MTILAAVPDSPEGRHALAAAAEEARALGTDLAVMNLGLRRLDEAKMPTDVVGTVVERSGHHREPADLVLTYLHDHPNISRLVIGVKHRTPIGKAVLGSLSQRLLLEAPVPVLAVKLPATSGEPHLPDSESHDQDAAGNGGVRASPRA